MSEIKWEVYKSKSASEWSEHLGKPEAKASTSQGLGDGKELVRGQFHKVPHLDKLVPRK